MMMTNKTFTSTQRQQVNLLQTPTIHLLALPGCEFLVARRVSEGQSILTRSLADASGYLRQFAVLNSFTTSACWYSRRMPRFKKCSALGIHLSCSGSVRPMVERGSLAESRILPFANTRFCRLQPMENLHEHS